MNAPRELTTERLSLRIWHEDEADEMRRVLDECDAHLRPWIPFMQGEPRSLCETADKLREARESFQRGEHLRYAARLPEGELIGEAMLLQRGPDDAREAGYWLHQDHCGHGFATEAVRALLPVAFAQPTVRRVLVRCDERNAASLRVASRLGAERIGTEELHERGVIARLVVLAIRRP